MFILKTFYKIENKRHVNKKKRINKWVKKDINEENVSLIILTDNALKCYLNFIINFVYNYYYFFFFVYKSLKKYIYKLKIIIKK